MENLTKKTETELRDVEVSYPDSIEELTKIIEQLTKRKHDYGTCVYAMSIAATATFNYVAHILGCTGFQASIADLDVLKRTRNLKNGFRIINYDNLLYPQYWDEEHFPSAERLLKENANRLSKEAKKLLRKNKSAHPDVIKHWQMIAEIPVEEQTKH